MSSDDLSEDTNGGPDGEGVWSPDIEQSFQEALHMYPPCGRRKIIINDDAGGKMYGRNELIARYIKVRTGKTRSRKQVSSHIQVLARRKIKENSTRVSSSTTTHLPTLTNNNNNTNNNIITNSNNNNSIVSVCNDSKSNLNLIDTVSSATSTTTLVNNNINSSSTPILINSTYDSSGIASQKLRLVEFFAFVKQCKISQNDSGNSTYPHHPPHHLHQNGHHHLYYHHQPVSPLPTNHLMMMHHHHHQFIDNNDNTHFLIHINQRRQAIQYEKVDIAQIQDKFPEKGGLRDLYNQGPKDAFFLVKCWANLNENELDDQNSFYGFSSHFESNEEMTVFCETKVCSFGNVTAELAHRQKAVFAHGRYHYHSQQPLCEYMAEFLDKLRHLPEIALMNHVLENFTILKVITDENTKETLLCIAFIFEVSEKHGATHNIYKLKGM